MKVVIAAISSNHFMSGVSRHAANLTRCLLTQSEISAVHLLVAPWERGYMNAAISTTDARLHIHTVPLRAGTMRRNHWYLSRLPAIAEQLRADVVHLSYPVPIAAAAFPCSTVVTLHDLYPYDIPSNFGFPKVFFNRLILRQCLRNAGAIACVSDSTRARLTARMHEMATKAVTICNSVELGPKPVRPSFVATWSNHPFLLCVAQHRRNKNVLLALRVFERVLASGYVAPEMRLVLVGIPGPESGRIQAFVREANLGDRVVLVNGISDAEISWCYRNCELLIAPSTIEGFGLPVAEARLAGCRVVCSDIPAFREVAAEGCKFVSLSADAEEQFVKAVLMSLRERRPLPASLPNLSPSRIAERYLQLYKQVLPQPTTSGIAPGLEPKESQPKQALADKVPTATRL